MIIDKYTKAIMTAIAISLFVIALNPWIAPTKAYAALDSMDISMFKRGLGNIASAINRINCSR